MKKNEINKRMKQLRNSLHFTQEKFGKIINLPTSSVYNYEANKNEVSERVISSVCRIFSVNETWLRTGEGEMLLRYNENIITDLVKEFELDESDKKLIHLFVHLTPEERSVIHSFINLMNKIHNNSINVE